uniref:EGF-like domain-containing protein n=1 Tax=Panagrellus redivivus TaxID=6233 RepID=A0A7E4VAT7_PANRE
MTFLVILFFIHGVTASIYYASDFYDHSSIKKENLDCDPLWDGPNCTIPFCFPGNGVRTELENGTKYICTCFKPEYITGTHCEVIECHDGRLKSATKCQCPKSLFGAYGRFCETPVINRVGAVIVFIFVLIYCFFYHSCKLEDEYRDPYRCCFIRDSTIMVVQTPMIRPDYAPSCIKVEKLEPTTNDITSEPRRVVERIVIERVVYRDVSDAPPTYETAVDPVHPQRCDAIVDSANLPTYETVIEAELPNY